MKGGIMKHCRTCGQHVADKIIACPSCGGDTINELSVIDGYRIDQVLHEGHGTILCRTTEISTGKPALIRIFKPDSGIDEKIADRLRRELEKLKTLPRDHFVSHFAICRSSEGLWYRVSEWNHTLSWGSLLASDRFKKPFKAIHLFTKIAQILDILHKKGHTIPHLILDDIIVIENSLHELDVKIDYKLSRFLNPLIDRPGPMLKKLLSCHPDILNNRPFDRQSDIWSLGKIFVEVLSGDHQTTDFHRKIEMLPLPDDIKVLFRIMLAEDPDLRPRSMKQVAKTLMRSTEDDFREAGKSHNISIFAAGRTINRLKTKLNLITFIMALLAAAGIITWFNLPIFEPSDEKTLENYANNYSKSMAFLMVEYQLTDQKRVVYKNRVEGSAFLADQEGYLLTNRHVACPWLEDNQLHFLINNLKLMGKFPDLNYALYLWFDGVKAFKRPPEKEAALELEDFYHLDTAFYTGGKHNLKIAGVARLPVKTRQLVKSPLKDDFAVLKIEKVPKGVTAIPMSENLDLKRLGKLTPVITLGFPLGHQTQENFVNTSVTRGHIRRTFDNLIQVDTSIHSGNSGGPLIDTSGKAIGIASRVAMSWTRGPIPFATQLPDMGMVLPISGAAAFIADLKSGKTKWRGGLDISVQSKIDAITQLAEDEKWEEAATAARNELKKSNDIRLIIAAGMMLFCTDDYLTAASYFKQALSMAPENMLAGYMLYLIDWFTNQPVYNPVKEKLLTLDWRSSMEFFGFLTQMLETSENRTSEISGGYYTLCEKSWILYNKALINEKYHHYENAEALLKKAVMAAGCDEWLYYLALARLKNLWNRQAVSQPQKESEDLIKQKQSEFLSSLKERRAVQVEKYKNLLPTLAMLDTGLHDPEKKLDLLKKLQKEKPENYNILASIAVYNVMNGFLEQSLDDCQKFIEIEGRENSTHLLINLLKPQILEMLGQKEEAFGAFNSFIKNTQNSWYRKIASCLTGKMTQAELTAEAGRDPAYLVTAHMALGIQAESKNDPQTAMRHYKEALGSYMDDWIEYEFSLERIKKLQVKKQASTIVE